jgi:hypothetical protein
LVGLMVSHDHAHSFSHRIELENVQQLVVFLYFVLVAVFVFVCDFAYDATSRFAQLVAFKIDSESICEINSNQIIRLFLKAKKFRIYLQQNLMKLSSSGDEALYFSALELSTWTVWHKLKISKNFLNFSSLNNRNELDQRHIHISS